MKVSIQSQLHRRCLILLALGWLATTPAAAQQAVALRDVVVVGSNWDGTAQIFDPHTFKVLKRIDIVPDRKERLEEIDNAGLVRRIGTSAAWCRSSGPRRSAWRSVIAAVA